MKYKSFKVDASFPPKFSKMMIEMNCGAKLAFSDPRRLGRILLREDPLGTTPISDLAADALLAVPSRETFVTALRPLSSAIKAALLDQSRVVSGVGNWMADEICYQARVHPGSPCCSLSISQFEAIRHSLECVTCTAVECLRKGKEYPSSWLFHFRWEKGKSKEIPRDADGMAITFDEVGGRTSAIVLSRQSKGQDGSVGKKKKEALHESSADMSHSSSKAAAKTTSRLPQKMGKAKVPSSKKLATAAPEEEQTPSLEDQKRKKRRKY